MQVKAKVIPVLIGINLTSRINLIGNSRLESGPAPTTD